jgi:hypothetical protein
LSRGKQACYKNNAKWQSPNVRIKVEAKVKVEVEKNIKFLALTLT